MSQQALWYFDFISPFSYLQLGRILSLRERLAITPVPILFLSVRSLVYGGLRQLRFDHQ